MLGRLKNNKILKLVYEALNPSTGVILMLHRVVDQYSIIIDNARLEVTASFLEETINDYRALGYHFISIDEAYKIQNKCSRRNGRYVCVTFDDGFKDNLTMALPILEKLKVPFVVYVATDFADNKICVWWYILQQIIIQLPEIKLVNGSRYQCVDNNAKNELFMLIKKEIQSLSNMESRSYLQALCAHNNLEMPESPDFLSWDDIRLLSSNTYCTIASHGVSHTSLTSLSYKQIEQELQESKTKIEANIGTVVNHFAYPYGHVNKYVANVAKNVGYLSAVCIDGGMQRLHQNKFLFKRQILSDIQKETR